ncbi:MAG: hypothetical protein AAGA31_08275 [Bacteroidota bacterium]
MYTKVKITPWIVLCLLLSTCYGINAQGGQIDCNNTYTFTDNQTVTPFAIPNVESISLNLRGGDGGKVRFRGSCGTEIKGGEAARVQVTFPVSETGNALRPGGQLLVFVGQRGENRTPLCSNAGRVAGAGGGSSAVLYLPPGFNANEAQWRILAVAGAGGGASRPFQGVTDIVGGGGRSSTSGGSISTHTGGSFVQYCPIGVGGIGLILPQGRGGGIFCSGPSDGVGGVFGGDGDSMVDGSVAHTGTLGSDSS